jgi:ATP-dependent RNA helicase DeaD
VEFDNNNFIKDVKMENLIFKNLNLSEEIQKAISAMGFEEATSIQSKTIPMILEGLDVIGQAQTGTGKTCAFGIPAVEILDKTSEGVQILVLCPTRELAIQISEELKEVSKYKKGIKILPIYGGQPIDRQITALKQRPQIIIGTPGRVMDHMRRHTLKFSALRMIVLDEADEMLNMGFREDIDTILEKVPEERQTLLFSATMPKEIIELTKKYQKSPVHIKATHTELTLPSTEQFYLEINESSKLEVLSRLIDTNSIKFSLVFCNTKKRVDELASHLQSRGYSAEALHGDMRQEQRDKVMAKFRKRRLEILIATDVAARGIDVSDVEAVFNYDLPNDEEYYVHRIGRTGRAGKTGKAFTFVVGREIYKLRDIQRYTKSKVQPIKPPTLLDVEEIKINSVMDKLKEIMQERHHSKYISYIEKFLADIPTNTEDENYTTSLDIAAGFLKLICEQGNTNNQTLEIDSNTFDDINEHGMVKLFLNIGSSNKVLPKHIVESIASNTSLPGKLIGAINIYDKFTFVEIPHEYATEVMETMKNYTIKGKRVNVEKSKGKKQPKKYAPM